MAKDSITDTIEKFLLDNLGDDGVLELSRNDLAKYFSCVPSQINYVLNTRFTVKRGFSIESERGGAGFVKLIRLNENKDAYINKLYKICENSITQTECLQILDSLKNKEYINDDEFNLLRIVMSNKALQNPIIMQNSIRSNILRELIGFLDRRKNN